MIEQQKLLTAEPFLQPPDDVFKRHMWIHMTEKVNQVQDESICNIQVR